MWLDRSSDVALRVEKAGREAAKGENVEIMGDFSCLPHGLGTFRSKQRGRISWYNKQLCLRTVSAAIDQRRGSAQFISECFSRSSVVEPLEDISHPMQSNAADLETESYPERPAWAQWISEASQKLENSLTRSWEGMSSILQAWRLVTIIEMKLRDYN